MPSFTLGCDWVGVIGKPPDFHAACSLKRGGHGMPDPMGYKIVIVQQAAGDAWVEYIQKLQANGTKVIYEVDDYLHGVRKVKSHRSKDGYTPKMLREYEKVMKVCDAMICSTPWLAAKYKSFNEHTFICLNSVEGRRYAKLNLPDRDTVNIGWAGGEGHLEALRDWIPAIRQVLDEYENVRFISMGLPAANLLVKDYPTQVVALPFISLENFPGALTNFDIAIAPAGRGGFYQGKSDLRFLETGALGIPLVADPFVYKDIEDARTGYLAETSEEALTALVNLLEMPGTRKQIGSDARRHVLSTRSIEVACEQWEKVFVAVWDQ
jgi:glycosyltransferase involved in cell wall biosynthesis